MQKEIENNWKEHIANLAAISLALKVSSLSGEITDIDEAFATFAKRTCATRTEKECVFLIGNGASASMASHVSADLAKNALIHTQVFTDLSLITALGNDIGYENVYAEPLRRRMKPHDMLIAISSSGNSPNIVKACNTAKELGGYVVTLSAMKEDNKIRQLGDLNFYAPAATYGDAETIHAAILHRWVDLVVNGI